MTRRRWRITLLGALATLAAVYPVTSLFQSSDWLPASVFMIALVAVTGVVVRGLVRSRVLVVAVQVVVAAYAVALVFVGDSFVLLVPTVETLVGANDLALQALDTAQRYSAPAPLNVGVSFCLAVIVALVAICVDAMAATWRSPAAAGLPLLTAYLITAANGQAALALRYFVVPVVLWLLMLHTTARAGFGRWGTASATDDEGRVDIGGDRAALRSFSAGAVRLGLVGVVLALVVPLAIPHFAPRYLTDGLGRSEGGDGGGSVGFNDTVDLTRSLNNLDTKPVFEYTTTDPSPGPIRVLAVSNYSRGEWSSLGNDGSGPDAPAPLPPADQRTTYEIDVSENTLAAPRLAVPYPVVSVALPDTVSWRTDPVTRDVRVSQAVATYRATFADLAPLATSLRESGTPDSADITPDDLAVPDIARDLLESWSREVVGDADNPLDKAIRIQDHLRSSRYEYRLDLGEPLRDEAGRIVEPIRTFYERRIGYCTQFATAMIMMARTQGIPARMAIGFLPGTQGDESNVVRASDAHAWPELYFQGYGWLRFEPTPGVRAGDPPPYTVVGDDPSTGGGGREATESASAAPTSSAAPTTTTTVAEAARTQATDTSSPLSSVFSVRTLVVVLSLIVLLLALFVMPITAWLVRRRRVAAATTRQDLVEIDWDDLTAHLHDLGLPDAGGGTLRQVRDRWISQGHLENEDAEALRRVTTTLERARYDRPERTTAAETDLLHRDIRDIRRRVGRSRAWQARLRSVLWPEAGVSVWRGLRERVTDAVGRR